MIKSETTVKKTISNLYSGEVVAAGYRRSDRVFMDTNRFIGFKVGENHFSNLQTLKKAYGVKNLKELEFETERVVDEVVYARFHDTGEGFTWAAYLWNGSFRVGTSADRLVLEAA